MGNAGRRLGRAAAGGLLGLLLLAACGTAPATPTAPPPTVPAVPTAVPTPPSATPAPLAPTATIAPPTATVVPPTATAMPPAPPTITVAPPTVIPETPVPVAARATSTPEPDACALSVGQVQNWELRVWNHQPGDTDAAVAGLADACAENRWLALWAVGSIHDPTTASAVQAYLARHPDGDWLGDEFDMVPLARATLAYLAAPQDPSHTYAVDMLRLYPQVPAFSANGGATPGPALTVAPGTALTVLGTAPTGATRADHGGETPLVFARVQRPNDPAVYYLDVSTYVAAYPRTFTPPTPAATP